MMPTKPIIICAALLIAATAANTLPRNDVIPIEFEVRSKNGDFQARATVDSSNMPTSWQVEAADDLKTAYELETTSYQRLYMLSGLFGDSHPEFSWQVVLNYEDIYYQSTYYIKMVVGGEDVILLFAKSAPAE